MATFSEPFRQTVSLPKVWRGFSSIFDGIMYQLYTRAENIQRLGPKRLSKRCQGGTIVSQKGIGYRDFPLKKTLTRPLQKYCQLKKQTWLCSSRSNETRVACSWQRNVTRWPKGLQSLLVFPGVTVMTSQRAWGWWPRELLHSVIWAAAIRKNLKSTFVRSTCQITSKIIENGLKNSGKVNSNAPLEIQAIIPRNVRETRISCPIKWK